MKMEKMKTKVIDLMTNPHLAFSHRYITDWKELIKVTDFLKSQGKRIGLVGGTWDLLHIGHVRYLRKARELVDVLIVAVDNDLLVKARKDPGRPVVPEMERFEIISELRVVDFVTVYDVKKRKGGEALVKRMKPDILIMSKSTNKRDSKQKVRGKKKRNESFTQKWQRIYKGICQVVVLPPQAVTSTSNVVRKLHTDGKNEIGLIFQRYLSMMQTDINRALAGTEKKSEAIKTVKKPMKKMSAKKKGAKK